jgi:hypothetical protein
MYYQTKRKDGTTYFTNRKKIKSIIGKIKYYIKDKWFWLLTFNKPPKVIINQDLVCYEDGPPAVIVNGRLRLTVNGDVILKDKEGKYCSIY